MQKDCLEFSYWVTRVKHPRNHFSLINYRFIIGIRSSHLYSRNLYLLEECLGIWSHEICIGKRDMIPHKEETLYNPLWAFSQGSRRDYIKVSNTEFAKLQVFKYFRHILHPSFLRCSFITCYYILDESMYTWALLFAQEVHRQLSSSVMK